MNAETLNRLQEQASLPDGIKPDITREDLATLLRERAHLISACRCGIELGGPGRVTSGQLLLQFAVDVVSR